MDCSCVLSDNSCLVGLMFPVYIFTPLNVCSGWFVRRGARSYVWQVTTVHVCQ